MDALSRRPGHSAPHTEPAEAFESIARILARAAIRRARQRPRIELESLPDLRLSVSTVADADAARQESRL